MQRHALAAMVLAVSAGCCLLAARAQALDPAPAAPSESAAATGPLPDASPQATQRDLHGLELLASVAYGTATEDVGQVDFEPYGATFTFEPGYTFRFGLRLGAYAQYGLGRQVHQTYDPVIGPNFEYDADGTTLSPGLSVGYDLPLYMFVLRYTLNLGFTRMTWDISDTRQEVDPFWKPQGTKYGAHMAPGLAVLWRVSRYECGLGMDYLIQVDDLFPTGVLGKLLLGVRL